MSRPRLLDLFCGAGGAAMGYHRAGFDVVGVDIAAQPRYPFTFIRADAFEVFAEDFWVLGGIGSFAAIHASPPCPLYSSLTGWGRSRRVSPDREDLVGPIRDLLRKTGLPYVIENVQGAPLKDTVRICGQSVGLKVRRHRYFEANFTIMVPPCWHPEPPYIVVRGSIGRKVFDPRRKALAPTLEEAREIMGMPWANASELADAVPPAYTELIGAQLLAHPRTKNRIHRKEGRMSDTTTLIDSRDIDAVVIALDELISYVDVVDYEGALDDEEMPTEKLRWAITQLQSLLDRYAAFEHVRAQADRHNRVVMVDPVRFTVRPTPPSGPNPHA